VVFAVSNAGTHVRDCVELEVEITLQHVGDVFTDAEFAEALPVGQPLEEQDALDQRVGVFHLVDGFAKFVVE
jgi:hypothetical protein